MAEEMGKNQRVERKWRAVRSQRFQRLDKRLLAGFIVREAVPLHVEPLAQHRCFISRIGCLDEVKGVTGGNSQAIAG